MWMCLPDFEIWTFQLGAFYHNLLKIHPIYVNRTPTCVTKKKKKKNCYTKIREKSPQKAGMYRPCQCENPLASSRFFFDRNLPSHLHFKKKSTHAQKI